MAHNPLWTREELIDATDGRWISSEKNTPEIHGVSIDSRTTEVGDLFIAIVGPNSDGHDYVAEALEKGAAAIVVSRSGLDIQGPTLLVNDTFEALNDLGAAARSRTDAKVIAITGSVGKTGTKDALAAVLSENGRTHKSVLSYNNHWGVPLSLARMPEDTEFAVLELGMNHPGELAPLSQLVKPGVVLITRIAPAHMEAFKSLKDVAKAKAEIFEGLQAGGTVILNADSPHYKDLVKAAKKAGAATITSFGQSADAQSRIIDFAARQSFSCVRGILGGEKITYKIGASGEHWIENSMAVLAAANAVGADLGKAGLTLAKFQPPKGRGNEYTIPLLRGVYTLIDDSYNANPTSMSAALRALASRDVGAGGRRIAVLGDMLELGTDSQAYHRNLIDDISGTDIDLVFCCGTEVRHLMDQMTPTKTGVLAETADELFLPVQDMLHDGDVVLVKASRGVGLDRLVDYLRSNAQLNSHAENVGNASDRGAQ